MNKSFWITKKIYGKKVLIKPFLSVKECIGIEKLCIKQFEKEPFELGMIKCIYDMFVVSVCSNLDVRGVSTKTDKNVVSISLDLKNEDISDFEENFIAFEVLKYVRNYFEEYCNILEILKMFNTRKSFAILGESIPSPESLSGSMKDTIKILAEEQKKNPENLKKAAEDFQESELLQELKKIKVQKGEKNDSKSSTVKANARKKTSKSI